MQRFYTISLLLLISSIINFCYAMEDGILEQNPPENFSTHYDVHSRNETNNDEIAQQALGEQVWFYKKRNENNSLVFAWEPDWGREDGKAFPAIDLKLFINNPKIKKFIIKEYKKDEEVIAKLITKIVLAEPSNSEDATVLKYPIENHITTSKGKVRPWIELDELLSDPNVREYAVQFYQTHQSFMEKHSNIAITIATFHGALGIATLWRLTKSDHFIEASMFTKISEIAMATICWIFLGKEMMQKLTNI